jgi:hypothetical protein
VAFAEGQARTLDQAVAEALTLSEQAAAGCGVFDRPKLLLDFAAYRWARCALRISVQVWYIA